MSMFEERIEKLRTFYQSEQRLPSYQEMISVLGYRSKGGVSRFVEHMIEQKVLGRKDGKLLHCSQIIHLIVNNYRNK